MPTDRRNSLVALTQAGLALFDRVTPAHVATENRLLAGLDDQQRKHLEELLRILLVSLEGTTTEPMFPRLGPTLAPAHVTMATRRAAGLPETVGSLVREVQPASRADQAGVKIGDVLVGADHLQVRSITALYAAISRAVREGILTVHAIRGERTRVTTTLDLRPRPDDDLPPGNASPPTRAVEHQL
ncbi:MAG: MarR family winged helix-turn-helix transcriptional regulator [Acidimicrobiales bacterium]